MSSGGSPVHASIASKSEQTMRSSCDQTWCIQSTSSGKLGCSDANWCTRQSTSGCAFKIGTAIVSYFSKKQGHISLSTFEAEISAGTLAACEAVHLRSLLASLGYKPKGPTIIKIDNTAALRVAEDPVMHNKTKHILRKELKIRELVESGEVKVEYVESLKNFADFFTKPLPRKEFESFRKEIMNDTA